MKTGKKLTHQANAAMTAPHGPTPVVVIETEDFGYYIQLEATSSPRPARMNYGGLPDPAEGPEYKVDERGCVMVDRTTGKEYEITHVAETLVDAAFDILDGDVPSSSNITGGYVE